MLLPRRVLLEERKKRMGWGTKQRNLLAHFAVRAVFFCPLLNRLPSARFGYAILGLDDLRNAAHTRTQYYTFKNNIDLVVKH